MMHGFEHISLIVSPLIPLTLFVKLKISVILLQCDFKSALEYKTSISYVLEDFSRWDLRNSLNILYGEDSVYALTYQQNSMIKGMFKKSRFPCISWSLQADVFSSCYSTQVTSPVIRLPVTPLLPDDRGIP